MNVEIASRKQEYCYYYHRSSSILRYVYYRRGKCDCDYHHCQRYSPSRYCCQVVVAVVGVAAVVQAKLGTC